MDQLNVIYRSKPRSNMLAFGWYGGKFSHLGWLLPLLPKCHHYCEPFAGSGAVLINREPSPIETYNDIDGDVVNFFRVLRDNHEELIRVISLTPYSREEYYHAIHSESSEISDVERARMFYINVMMSRMSISHDTSIGQWGYSKDAASSGMSGSVSKYLHGVSRLEYVAKRLLRVQIENRPAMDLIKLHDRPTTLFYCDPPYVHSTRTSRKIYSNEMDDSQHIELYNILNDCTAMVAVSCYDSPLIDEILKPGRWFKTIAKSKKSSNYKNHRTEVLWTNYDPSILQGQSLAF
jgi:DNA adenine methylase